MSRVLQAEARPFLASGCNVKPMINPNINSPDDELEARIDHQASLLRQDRSPDENYATWLELTRLHQMRSPEKIRELEEARGLR